MNQQEKTQVEVTNITTKKITTKKVPKKVPNESPKRKSLPQKKRINVWKNMFKTSNVGNCYCCQDVIEQHTFECGHIIAVAKGGSDDITNLRPICSSCNKSIGTENMNEVIKRDYPNAYAKRIEEERKLEMIKKEELKLEINKKEMENRYILISNSI
jgi:5-methylcytosine-specific restriction endonuclease McrA